MVNTRSQLDNLCIPLCFDFPVHSSKRSAYFTSVYHPASYRTGHQNGRKFLHQPRSLTENIENMPTAIPVLSTFPVKSEA